MISKSAETSFWIQKAQELMTQYQLPEMNSQGLDRDLLKYCFTATYPPLKAMGKVSPEQIYPNLYQGPLSVYFHFPFCSGRCSFCHFNVLTNPKTDHLTDYKKALLRELEIVSGLVQESDTRSVYFGGGTPSLLEPADVSMFLESLNDFSSISKSAPVTLEIHPEVIETKAKTYLRLIRQAGVNRVSIGVQDFNAQVLKATHRRHTPEAALKVIQEAQSLGFQVNMDLLSPLPFQTLESWVDTLKKAFSLNVDSITLYTTSIRKSMPLFEDFKSAQDFPNQIETYLMQILAQIVCEDYGYHEKSSRWFTKKPKNPGLEKILSLAQAMEKTSPLLGLGCGAYGQMHDFQYYNTPKMQTYLEHINNWELPIWQGMALSNEEKMHREIIFAIRSGELHFPKFHKHYQTDVPSHFSQPLSLLRHLKLAEFDESALRLTNKGKIWSDEIATLFMSRAVKDSLQEKTYLANSQHYLFEHLNHFYEI